MGDDVPVTTTVRARPDSAAVAAVDAARAALLEDVDAAVDQGLQALLGNV